MPITKASTPSSTTHSNPTSNPRTMTSDSYQQQHLLTNKLQILANANETSATCIITDEDHTLGNSLRYILAKHPTTDFVGYSVPHPSEHNIHLRLQTRRAPKSRTTNTTKASTSTTSDLPVTVSVALDSGLQFLSDYCDLLSSKFTAAEVIAHSESSKNSALNSSLSSEPSESDVEKLVEDAQDEAERIRQKHASTDMEAQD